MILSANSTKWFNLKTTMPTFNSVLRYVQSLPLNEGMVDAFTLENKINSLFFDKVMIQLVNTDPDDTARER